MVTYGDMTRLKVSDGNGPKWPSEMRICVLTVGATKYFALGVRYLLEMFRNTKFDRQIVTGLIYRCFTSHRSCRGDNKKRVQGPLSPHC